MRRETCNYCDNKAVYTLETYLSHEDEVDGKKTEIGVCEDCDKGFSVCASCGTALQDGEDSILYSRAHEPYCETCFIVEFSDISREQVKELHGITNAVAALTFRLPKHGRASEWMSEILDKFYAMFDAMTDDGSDKPCF